MKRPSKEDLTEIFQISHEKGLRCGLLAILMASIRALISGKKFKFSKIARNPMLIPSLLYSNRSAFLFCYCHPFLFISLSDLIPYYTSLSPLKSDIIASLISGLSVFLDSPIQQSFVSTWSISKSIEALCVYSYRNNYIRLPFGARLICSAFVAQLYYFLIYKPLNLPISRLKSVLNRIPLDNLNNLDNLIRQSKDLKFNPNLLEICYRCRSNNNGDSLCSFAHSKNESCLINSIKLGYKFTKKNTLYFLVLSLLPTLIFNRESVIRRPYSVLSKKFIQVSRTLSFIFFSTSLLSLQTCKSNWINDTKSDSKLLKLKTLSQAFLTIFLASFIVTEAKLGYFNFILGPLAVNSIFNGLKSMGILKDMRYFAPISYIIGFGTLSLFTRHNPKLLNSLDRSGLQYFFLKSRILK